MLQRRTDLAIEAREIADSGSRAEDFHGVFAEERVRGGFPVTTVRVEDENGVRALKKPLGTYVTLELDKLLRREDDAFSLGAFALAAELEQLLNLDDDDSVLVVGLGNRAITADAIGPETVRSTMVTSHLIEHVPEHFTGFRPVCALETGVLGTTGIESSQMIRAVVDSQRPDRVIVVDALASRRITRICRTVQLTDAGITPGSGVGNARARIDAETLGVPVVAVGVPTVVDAATLAADIAEQVGLGDEDIGALEGFGGELVVTPKDIDAHVNDISKLLGYAINLALHDGLTIEDVTMFLG